METLLNLKDATLLRDGNYIAGKWCQADDSSTVDVTNPENDEVIVAVPNVSVTPLCMAIEAAVTIGPLVGMEAVKKVEEHIAGATSKGVTVITGDKRYKMGRSFFEPTVITGMTSRMKVATEGTFGSVAPLFKFEDDVICQANDMAFGLTSYFYARDRARGWRVIEALEYGVVCVSTGLVSTEIAPSGGIKQSGLEGSYIGLEDYVETKDICLSLSLYS